MSDGHLRWSSNKLKLTTLLGRDKSDHVREEVLEGSMPIWVTGPTEIYLQHSIQKSQGSLYYK